MTVRSRSIKTYIVAGFIRCGTSAMMKAIIAGGIEGLYRPVRHQDRGYPYQTYEVAWGPLKCDDVSGKVVKQFGASLVDNMPKNISNLHVVYMIRDQESRASAHPELISKDYWEMNTRNIGRILSDTRVSSLVVMDFDYLINYPLIAVMELSAKGWGIDCEKASKAINKNINRGEQSVLQ